MDLLAKIYLPAMRAKRVQSKTAFVKKTETVILWRAFSPNSAYNLRQERRRKLLFSLKGEGVGPAT